MQIKNHHTKITQHTKNQQTKTNSTTHYTLKKSKKVTSTNIALVSFENKDKKNWFPLL